MHFDLHVNRDGVNISARAIELDGADKVLPSGYMELDVTACSACRLPRCHERLHRHRDKEARNNGLNTRKKKKKKRT